MITTKVLIQLPKCYRQIIINGICVSYIAITNT